MGPVIAIVLSIAYYCFTVTQNNHYHNNALASYRPANGLLDYIFQPRLPESILYQFEPLSIVVQAKTPTTTGVESATTIFDTASSNTASLGASAWDTPRSERTTSPTKSVQEAITEIWGVLPETSQRSSREATRNGATVDAVPPVQETQRAANALQLYESGASTPYGLLVDHFQAMFTLMTSRLCILTDAIAPWRDSALVLVTRYSTQFLQQHLPTLLGQVWNIYFIANCVFFLYIYKFARLFWMRRAVQKEETRFNERHKDVLTFRSFFDSEYNILQQMADDINKVQERLLADAEDLAYKYDFPQGLKMDSSSLKAVMRPVTVGSLRHAFLSTLQGYQQLQASLERAAPSRQQELVDLTERFEDLEREHEKLLEYHEDYHSQRWRTGNLIQENDGLREKSEALYRLNGNLQRDKEDLRVQVESLQDKEKEVANEIDSMNKKNVDLVNQKDDLRKQVEEMDRILSEQKARTAEDRAHVQKCCAQAESDDPSAQIATVRRRLFANQAPVNRIRTKAELSMDVLRSPVRNPAPVVLPKRAKNVLQIASPTKGIPKPLESSEAKSLRRTSIGSAEVVFWLPEGPDPFLADSTEGKDQRNSFDICTSNPDTINLPASPNITTATKPDSVIKNTPTRAPKDIATDQPAEREGTSLDSTDLPADQPTGREETSLDSKGLPVDQSPSESTKRENVNELASQSSKEVHQGSGIHEKHVKRLYSAESGSPNRSDMLDAQNDGVGPGNDIAGEAADPHDIGLTNSSIWRQSVTATDKPPHNLVSGDAEQNQTQEPASAAVISPEPVVAASEIDPEATTEKSEQPMHSYMTVDHVARELEDQDMYNSPVPLVFPSMDDRSPTLSAGSTAQSVELVRASNSSMHELTARDLAELVNTYPADIVNAEQLPPDSHRPVPRKGNSFSEDHVNGGLETPEYLPINYQTNPKIDDFTTQYNEGDLAQHQRQSSSFEDPDNLFDISQLSGDFDSHPPSFDIELTDAPEPDIAELDVSKAGDGQDSDIVMVKTDRASRRFDDVDIDDAKVTGLPANVHQKYMKTTAQEQSDVFQYYRSVAPSEGESSTDTGTKFSSRSNMQTRHSLPRQSQDSAKEPSPTLSYEGEDSKNTSPDSAHSSLPKYETAPEYVTEQVNPLTKDRAGQAVADKVSPEIAEKTSDTTPKAKNRRDRNQLVASQLQEEATVSQRAHSQSAPYSIQTNLPFQGNIQVASIDDDIQNHQSKNCQELELSDEELKQILFARSLKSTTAPTGTTTSVNEPDKTEVVDDGSATIPTNAEQSIMDRLDSKNSMTSLLGNWIQISLDKHKLDRPNVGFLDQIYTDVSNMVDSMFLEDGELNCSDDNLTHYLDCRNVCKQKSLVVTRYLLDTLSAEPQPNNFTIQDNNSTAQDMGPYREPLAPNDSSESKYVCDQISPPDASDTVFSEVPSEGQCLFAPPSQIFKGKCKYRTPEKSTHDNFGDETVRRHGVEIVTPNRGYQEHRTRLSNTPTRTTYLASSGNEVDITSYDSQDDENVPEDHVGHADQGAAEYQLPPGYAEASPVFANAADVYRYKSPVRTPTSAGSQAKFAMQRPDDEEEEMDVSSFVNRDDESSHLLWLPTSEEGEVEEPSKPSVQGKRKFAKPKSRKAKRAAKPTKEAN